MGVGNMIKTVSVQELCEQLESDPESVLIDVRSPQEFEQGHVAQACNIPVGSMPLRQILAEWSREVEGRPIYFICQSGGCSQQVIDDLEDLGFRSAQCVAGGMLAWQALGLPVKLENSAAGDFHPGRASQTVYALLVLVGCVLGLLVNKGFFAVPVLVALEMLFAGLTGWPGLGSFFGRQDREI